MHALGSETLPLHLSLGRILARSLRSPIDVPPFDRSQVDGFAVNASDLALASDNGPVGLRLNPETIACGFLPQIELAAGTATQIATGGPIPRGADAIVMVEQADPDGQGSLWLRRGAAPGQNIGFAGSDIAKGETLLRRGAKIGSREIGMMAACGIAEVPVYRKPRVAILSTGDELIAPGEPLPPAAIYDSNGPILAAAVTENGGEVLNFGIIRDSAEKLEKALHEALGLADMVIFSGGTSKSAGDLTYRIVAKLGPPGIIAHGVALKPGKPLCLAVAEGKPVIVLPGFPTSAMFTFHDFVVPVLRGMAGLPARADLAIEAVTSSPLLSDLGRTEFVMVALTHAPGGLNAFPLGKSSGSITSFTQADGFLTIPSLTEALPRGSVVNVTLFDPDIIIPAITIIGSHCIGLEIILDELAEQGIQARLVSAGSLGGLTAAKRGEADICPIHLLDAETGVYNKPFLNKDLVLVEGWRRMQGFVFRSGDPRFEGKSASDAIAAALAEPACIMVSRNAGAGTRILIDQLIGAARPQGYWNQPKSHNAVAASIAQNRADWGVAIKPVAESYGLSFLPIGEEHYDFAIPHAKLGHAGVQAFLEILRAEHTGRALREIGLIPVEVRVVEPTCV